MSDSLGTAYPFQPDDGRVVIVTGSARGLGRAFSEMFARDGFRVALCDVNGEGAQRTADEISSSGGLALGFACDVTDASSTEQMARRVIDEWGVIDVLVNNAGLYGDHHFDPVLETEPDYWDTVLAINLKGPLLCSRAVAPYMKRQTRGRIVNISSMGAYILGGVYSISKLALNHLTWSLASELGAFGITVNAVGPGTMDVPSAHRQNTPEDLEDRAARSMIKRIGKPLDIYAAIRYFASDAAEWCTGQTLLVNGGFNVHI